LAELEHIRKVAWEAMLKAQAMLWIKNPGGKKFRVKTLQGLKILNVSMRDCECNDQWFKGSRKRA
jgi:hypothetical protein